MLFFGTLLIAFAAQGQSRIGLKAGINLANQTKRMSLPQQPATKRDTRMFTGYQCGVFYKAKLSDKLSLSAEPAFSVIGSRMTFFTSNVTSYDTREKVGYIELPLAVQYSMNRFYFGVGPGIGIKLFSKLVGFEGASFDISDYKSIDVAGNIVAGFALLKKIDLNVRYSHGFTNIIKDPGYARTKNRSFSFSVLYYLK